MHRHRSAVALPDGTPIVAVSFHASDPYDRGHPPDHGLDLDRHRGPTTTSTGPTSVSRTTRRSSWRRWAPCCSALAPASASRWDASAATGERAPPWRASPPRAAIGPTRRWREAMAWTRSSYCTMAVETAEEEAFVAAQER